MSDVSVSDRDDILSKLLPFYMGPAGDAGGELATTGDQPTPQDRRPGDIEPANEVLDAEIVDEEDYQRSRARRGAALVVRRAKVVRHHPATGALTTVGRVGLRHAVIVGYGHASWAKRASTAMSHGVLREQIRQARLLGDQEALGAWQDRLRAERDARHARIQRLPHTLAKGMLALFVALVILAGLALFVGVILALSPGSLGWFGWWGLLGDIVGVTGLVITVAIHVGLWAAAPAWLLVAWREGRRAAAEVPRWLRPANDRSVGDPITPSKVVTALRDLGIAKMAQAIKAMDDAGAAMLGPIKIAGCGVEVDVLLPSGVNTADVQKRRRTLAENLDRHEHEVFVTIPEAARSVRLWIADSGALDEPIGPSPLVIDPTATADLYNGRAPWGQDLRGDAAAIALLQRHLLITGLSNQGKTAALRALVLWLALDRTCEFRIGDLKGVGDWRMFEQLATVLIQGPTDEHVIAVTEMLEEGVREMERRIKALEESGATDGVTREMARSSKGFHPLFLVVDEAQVAFMCPAVGEDRRPYGGTKATSRYFMAARKIHNQGRAVNVVLYQGTQDPTDQNLPKLVREGAHIRASLVVGTEEQARMALGDKAVNAGAAPHKLRQGLDKGTLVVTGDGVPLPAGQASLTIRTHFMSGQDAAAVADRAKELRGAVTTEAGLEGERRDLLADLEHVMGDESRVQTDMIRKRLAQLSHVYAKWSASDLKSALAVFGVEPYKSGGLMVVAASDVASARSIDD